jgi:alkyl hydroperoxide reductase subunit F
MHEGSKSMEFPKLILNMASMDQQPAPDPTVTYDVLILGGGPAAMSAAIYAARKMLKIALIAKEYGGQVAWTSQIENYLGFQSITGKELTDRFIEQMQQFSIPVQQGQKVVEVRKSGELFESRMENGLILNSRTIIIATGKRDRPLGVPGEAELVGRGVAYCAICDAPFYKDKRVVIAGGGNSAFTAALDLIKMASHVTLINLMPGWQADPIMIEDVHKAGDRVAFLDRRRILSIEGKDRVTGVRIRDLSNDREELLTIDGVFVEIGLVPNSEAVKDLVRLNAALEVIVDCTCHTSVPGVFGAGDVTTVPHKQIIIAGGEGAKAALSAHEYLVKNRLI